MPNPGTWIDADGQVTSMAASGNVLVRRMFNTRVFTP